MSRILGAMFAVALPAGMAASPPFSVFDNMYYAHKPDLSAAGWVPSSVIYTAGELKTAIAEHRLPDEAAFKAMVRAKSAGRPGPIVIDIEYVFLSRRAKTTDAEVHDHFKLFITLARWAKEAVPGHLVGYYGHGLFPEEPGKDYAAETQQLCDAVDAFFPSMYTFGNRTEAEWADKLHALMAQAQRIAPGKPVYPYVWPQYHEGAAKALEYLPGEQMRFELDTARAAGAAGVVYWSSSRAVWGDRPWLHVTEDFMATHPQRQAPSGGGPVKTGHFDSE